MIRKETVTNRYKATPGTLLSYVVILIRILEAQISRFFVYRFLINRLYSSR